MTHTVTGIPALPLTGTEFGGEVEFNAQLLAYVKLLVAELVKVEADIVSMDGRVTTLEG